MWMHHAHVLYLVLSSRVVHANPVPFGERAVDNSDEENDAFELVEPGVKHQRPGRCVDVATRRGKAVYNRFQNGVHALAGLGGGHEDGVGMQSEGLLHLSSNRGRVRSRLVNLVDDWQQCEAERERQVIIRDRLGLDALHAVHQHHRPLRCRHRARHLIREVHVPGRVNEVQQVPPALPTRVHQRHRLRLHGNAALPLDGEFIEKLGRRFPDGPCDFQKTICQGRLAMVDVSDYAEIADSFWRKS
mmetsp:Transcript_18476/g.31852  ORF Transcript_18476/g.31852 Transcript_18476/m.31852 type:complete len:245 (-) Transcript_18476:150-884(-)